MDAPSAMQPIPRRPPKQTAVCLHPDTLQPIQPKPDFFVDGLLSIATEVWESVTGDLPPPPSASLIASGPSELRSRHDYGGHVLPPDDGGVAEAEAAAAAEDAAEAARWPVRREKSVASELLLSMALTGRWVSLTAASHARYSQAGTSCLSRRTGRCSADHRERMLASQAVGSAETCGRAGIRARRACV